MAEETFRSKLRNDPAVTGFIDNLANYLTTKAESVATKTTDRLEAKDEGEEEGPVEGAKKGAKWGAVKGAISGFFGKFKGKGKAKRPVNIVEIVDIGAPIEACWDAWNNYEEMAGFMKGVESVSVDKEDEAKTDWKAKVFIHRRQWKGIVDESDPPNRLKWHTEANKGTVDGAIVFTPMGDNLTRMLVVIEYRSKGFFETIGKTWRVQGRRIRLDIKHFVRHVTVQEQLGQREEEAPDQEEQETGIPDSPEGDTEEQQAEPTRPRRQPRRPREPRERRETADAGHARDAGSGRDDSVNE